MSSDGLTRERIESETMFMWGELDDGQGQRWLQHDGAGNAWTPDPEVLQLLALIDPRDESERAFDAAYHPAQPDRAAPVGLETYTAGYEDGWTAVMARIDDVVRQANVAGNVPVRKLLSALEIDGSIGEVLHAGTKRFAAQPEGTK